MFIRYAQAVIAGLAAAALVTTWPAISQTAPMKDMPGMPKSAASTKPAKGVKNSSKPMRGTNDMQGMKGMYMRMAPMAGMSKSAPMPVLAEKRVSLVNGDEDWTALRGFGNDAPMAGMMTLMMVGGSGMEHMKMAGMTRAEPVKAPEMPGATVLTTQAVDAPTTKSLTPSQQSLVPTHPQSTLPAPTPVPAPTTPGQPATTGGQEPTAASPTSAVTPQPPGDTDAGLTITVAVTPNPPRVGMNTLQITVTDAAAMPVTGLKIVSAISMTSMDMGTTHPAAKEVKPGFYELPFQLSMQGPWQVVVMTPPTATNKGGKLLATLHFEAGGKQKWVMPAAGLQITCNLQPTAGKVGVNTLDFTVKNAAGAPVAGATVTTEVLMTSMDMGTTHPAAKELANGTYRTQAMFSMVGPWRVKLKVAQKGQPAVEKLFDFKAK